MYQFFSRLIPGMLIACKFNCAVNNFFCKQLNLFLLEFNALLAKFAFWLIFFIPFIEVILWNLIGFIIKRLNLLKHLIAILFLWIWPHGISNIFQNIQNLTVFRSIPRHLSMLLNNLFRIQYPLIQKCILELKINLLFWIHQMFLIVEL